MVPAKEHLIFAPLKIGSRTISLEEEKTENSPEIIKNNEQSISIKRRHIPHLGYDEKEKNNNSFNTLLPTT